MNALIFLAVATTYAMPPLTSEEVGKAEELRKYVFSTNDERGVGRGVDQRRIDALSEEERQFLITYFHAHLDSMRKDPQSESSLRSSGTARHLARLDDAWGLEAVAMNFRAQPRAEWNGEFKFVRNAKLIPMVGDLLFREEEMVWTEDLGIPPTQWTTAQGIIQTLRYAPQFQPDIPQWAQQLEDAWSKPGGNVIKILREWYRENEEKLRTQAFAEIRPGRTSQPTAAAASMPSSLQEAAPAAPDPKPVTVAAIPQPEAKSYFIEIAAAAAVALLAGLLFFWKRRA